MLALFFHGIIIEIQYIWKCHFLLKDFYIDNNFYNSYYFFKRGEREKTNAHRKTKHTHCGSKPDYDDACFLAPREPWFSKQVLCLRKIGSLLSHSTCIGKSSLARWHAEATRRVCSNVRRQNNRLNSMNCLGERPLLV